MGSYGIVSKQRHLSIENLDYRIEELENNEEEAWKNYPS